VPAPVVCAESPVDISAAQRMIRNSRVDIVGRPLRTTVGPVYLPYPKRSMASNNNLLSERLTSREALGGIRIRAGRPLVAGRSDIPYK
jgi:hypothetical protein